MNLIRTIVALLILFSCLDSIAQTSTLPLSDYYFHLSGPQSGIFNGREYQRLPYTVNKGIPYYRTDSLTAGTVLYDGLQYEQVPLMYDQISDDLITYDYTGTNLVRLVKQKVDRFSIYSADFICLPDTKTTGGYYEIIYKGSTQILKKEIKRILSYVKESQLQRDVEVKSVYLGFIDNQFTEISNAAAISDRITSKKEEVKKYLKENRRRLGKMKTDEAIIAVAAYYDQLNK